MEILNTQNKKQKIETYTSKSEVLEINLAPFATKAHRLLHY